MRLETFRIQNCFGFVDSGDIQIAELGNLTYFLGKNSSGKTSVLRALAYFESNMTPEDHPNFANYEPPDSTPLLKASFSLQDADAEKRLSPKPLTDYVINHFRSVPAEFSREGEGFVSDPRSAPASTVAQLLNIIEDVYSAFIEEVREADRIWVEKLGDGSYRFLGSGNNYESFDERRNKIELALGSKLIEGAEFKPKSGSARKAKPLAFRMVENQLFHQFPEIFVFTDRFALKDDLPRSVQQRHLDTEQNALTEAFMNILGKGTLNEFLAASRSGKITELESVLNSKLINLYSKINEDYGGAEDELVRMWVDRRDNARIIVEVDGKESHYEHLSDNTKFLVAYHVFQEDRERKNSAGSVLLFDEPDQGFHPSAEGKMLQFLDTLAQKSNQVVVTTHSQYLIDQDRLTAIRLMNLDEDSGTPHVSNGIRRPPTAGGDMLALQPVLEAIGLHYASQLTAQDKIIVTEGYTDMLYLRAFKRILGHEAELNIAPLRGESQIGHFIPFLISQDAAFKITLDSEAIKNSLREDFPIGDQHFFVVPVADEAHREYGTGIEDLFTREDFATLIERYGLALNRKKFEKLPNSKYAKIENGGRAKRLVAAGLYDEANTVAAVLFSEKTLENFREALDFCADDNWFKSAP